MIDWLKAKITGKKYQCKDCNKFISNEKIHELIEDDSIWCKGGGFCCPNQNVNYFISTDKNDYFCIKFKHKKEIKK